MAKGKLLDRVANVTLKDIGNNVTKMFYRMTSKHVLEQVALQVGAKQANLPAIIKALDRHVDISRKGYEQIGNTEAISLMYSQFSDQPKENLEILAGLYETHPWVFVCVNYISTALAGVPLNIKKAVGYDDGKEVLEDANDTDVGRMYRWINPHQSPFDFKEALAAWLLLCGEAYIVYAEPTPQTPKGVPAEMYVLFTPFVTKIVSQQNALIGIEYNVGGDSSIFAASEFTHFKTFSPTGRFRGQGQAAAAIKTISSDMKLRDFNDRVLTQGVHLSGILHTDNDEIGKEDALAIREKFEQQYAGTSKAAKIAVLWGGLQFTPQTILQKDVMMTEQVEGNRNEVIASFGLKAELITEKFANKATAETVRRMAYEDTIIGKHGERIASTLSATGLALFDPDLRAVWSTEEVPAMQTSQKEKVDTGKIAIESGQMTINEVRTNILKLEPLPDAECELVWIGGKPAYMAMIANEPSNDDNNTDKPVKTATHRVFVKNTYGTIETKDADFKLIFEKDRLTSENRLHRALRATFRDLSTRTGKIVTRSTVNAEMLTQIEQVFMYDGRKMVAKNVTESLMTTIDDTVEKEMVRLGIAGAFDVKPVRALERLAMQEQRVRNMMGKKWPKLRSSIGEGMNLGESEINLKKRVNEFFGGMKNNALTIARTETLPAINGAAMDVAHQAREHGVNVVSYWSTNKDELVRRPPDSNYNHMEAEGLKIVPGEEMFLVSGERLEYPGDSWNGASPGNTINCRCGVRNEVLKPNADPRA